MLSSCSPSSCAAVGGQVVSSGWLLALVYFSIYQGREKLFLETVLRLVKKKKNTPSQAF